MLTKDIAREIRFLRRAVLRAGFTCFGALPLFSGDEVIGATTVASRIIQRLERALG